ncbi:hypothetical protein INT45_003954 [Circinella minor]|uniref:Transmembrane protein n=1 Tax=Circinella minor TaxID=1195481 RepID=A0A8H7RWS6_9FUNG|nr:hypothetical protein INT45_003954 [Circinella minor]
MEYDPPLFEGTTTQERYISNVISFFVMCFVLFTLASSIIHGFGKSPVHLFFGISVLVFALCLRKLIKWWNIGDLDPKFKWVIIAHAGSLSLLCIVANVYIWATPSCSVC